MACSSRFPNQLDDDRHPKVSLLRKSYKPKTLRLLSSTFMSRPAAEVSTPTPTVRRSGGTATMAGARPGRYDKYSWITCSFMVLFHVGAVAALFNFTWSGLIVLVATYYVSLAWGIGMAYHRLLTHRSYKTCLLYTSDAADERSSVDLG